MILEKVFQDNIAKEFNIGKTHIKICTDYCVENPIEVRKILNDIAKKALPNLNEFSLKETY